MSAAAHPAKKTASANVPLPAEILRFRASERQLHWAVAVPFMVCYASALVLVAVYNPDPNRHFRIVFSWIHRVSGVCLFLLPLWTLLRHRHDFDVHFRNVRTAWRWRLEDVTWLFLMGLAAFRRVDLPDQGKFNAGEKLNFMFLTASYPLYIITGFLIWLPGVAFLSWIVHLSMAALATPLILGHVFMATVNPDTRAGLQGMIPGHVDRQWAQHHYRRWYNEHFGHLHKTPVTAPETDLASPVAALCDVEPDDAPLDSALLAVDKNKEDEDSHPQAWPQIMRPAPGARPIPEAM